MNQSQSQVQNWNKDQPQTIPDVSYLMPTPDKVIKGPDNWKEQIAKYWWNVKVADQALQVEKDGRRQLIVERLIKKTQDGTLGKQTKESMDLALEEDPMGVKIGDTQNFYLPSQQSDQVQTKKSLWDRLGPILLGAALGGGALWYLNKDKLPIIPQADSWETEIQLEK